ncbi:hypothetical protein FRB90_005008 [Tulasnella sp. 427]|nr:hypothetical protein FRB90_005008 [Tulasnella sp. 427]
MAPTTAIVHAGHFAPYTADPNVSATVIFPDHRLQFMTSLLQNAGLTLVTWAFSHRFMTIPWGNWKRIPDAKVPNIIAVMVFGVSWAFLFSASILVTGAGLALNETTCAMAIYACIILYASSKILIYAFLIEKVWLVWRKDYKTTLKARWNNVVWRTGMIGLCLYIGILILMLVGKQTEIRPRDGVCIIGLSRFSSIPLLSFDLFITVALTALFVRPLWATDRVKGKLRRLAIKTVVSSGVALGTSAVNIAVLTILHGKELGWVCLTSCGGDVTINALVLYIVTRGCEKQDGTAGGPGVGSSGPIVEANPPPPPTPVPINDRKLMMDTMKRHGLANNPLSPTLSLAAGRSPSIAQVPPPSPPTPSQPIGHVHFLGASNDAHPLNPDLIMKINGEGSEMEDSQHHAVMPVLSNRPRIGSFSTTNSDTKSPSMSTPASSGVTVFKSIRPQSDSIMQLTVAGGEARRQSGRSVRNSLTAVATGARNLVRNVGEVLQWRSHGEAEPRAPPMGVQVTVTTEEAIVEVEKGGDDLKEKGHYAETESQESRSAH